MKNLFFKCSIVFTLAFIALFIYQGATLAGITGKISGIITDAATGEPLPAVNIVIEGTTLGGAADNEGHYFIINIPPGTYSLQASMVGYTVESKTGIIVNVDHTTPVDFDLRVSAIAGEEITVTAEREIIPMDISASQIVADAEQIVETPMVNDIGDFINLQAGVSGVSVRGGGSDETQFMMDGLMVVDNRTNRPMMMVNLSAVKELNIVKGGFNAEYGNVRSGLINVITKEGSPSVYHGSIDYRYRPAHQKHSGVSIYNHNNFYLRPYLDEDVCWVGTTNGTWDEEMQDKYYEFIGWNKIAEGIDGMSAEDCRNLFMWQTQAEGSSALAPEGYNRPEGKYGDKPDWNVDASFGGPVPLIGKYLGNLSFFTSYRKNMDAYAMPNNRDYYEEETSSFKLTSRISQSMRITVEGLYGEILSVARSSEGAGINYYDTSGNNLGNQTYSGQGGQTLDDSELTTINVKFDLTSQIDRHNQIKVGFMFNYDDIDADYQSYLIVGPSNGWTMKWEQYPYRFGAYVQDKLEFEGMIANFGLRLDYNQPNCDWFTADRYSKYFKDKNVFLTLTPREPAKGHLKISPRLGVSHPISDNAKLYFNYGHFYSMPGSDGMYRIQYDPRAGTRVRSIGNPSADLPQTVSYELGTEYNVRNLFLIHLSGYYKDVRDQTGWVGYENYDSSVAYDTVENNNYEDIRGFELRIDKRFGRWITGWLNYDYRVTTSGYVGRDQYYQDEMKMRLYGLQNPYQERPIARPLARANILFKSPSDFGPTMAGIKPISDISLGFLFYWRAGSYMDWDPMDLLLQDNLQWKDSWDVDARFSKRALFGRYNLTIFFDINNLLNRKTLSTQGFADSEDSDAYYLSLRLPMYEGQIYQDAGYIAGNDKPGDIQSDDKPYINMPNREFLTFSGLRTVFFGLKLNF